MTELNDDAIKAARDLIKAEADMVRRHAVEGAAAAMLSIDRAEAKELQAVRERYAARRAKLSKKLGRVTAMDDFDLWHKYRAVGSAEGWIYQYREMSAEGGE